MKFCKCPVSQTIGNKAQDCGVQVGCKSSASLKPLRSVHFPNDIVFLDYIRHGELERIGLFIRARRVNLETIYHSGMAAIHEAVLSGNLECVKLLVNHGADVHQRDEEGWTPLHMACSDGFPHIARYLLKLGADPKLENDCGDKPSDLIDLDNKELLELFGLTING
ncbi:protein phosphatase 1 regulatory subunit 27b [Clinocottus analis]|uniref:protein phosphatase 1 regulatory subunit 27b n=1 Tax=Clinocottus analis TaxID=304258 RepID=UPI0035C256CE